MTWCPIALAAQGLVPILGRWWCQVSVLPVSVARLDTDFHADPLAYLPRHSKSLPRWNNVLVWYSVVLPVQGVIPLLEGRWRQVTGLPVPLARFDTDVDADPLQRASLHVPSGQKHCHIGRHSSHGGPQLSDGVSGNPFWLQAYGICGLCLSWPQCDAILRKAG